MSKPECPEGWAADPALDLRNARGVWLNQDETLSAELLELRFADGRVVKFTGSGHEGNLPPGTIYINRFPTFIHSLQIQQGHLGSVVDNRPHHTNPEAVQQSLRPRG